MTDIYEDKSSTKESAPSETNENSSWGARLFIGTLFVVLAFFWWLLIYSGGVGGHHG